MTQAIERPVCPQCGTPSPALTQFGLFDLSDDKAAEFAASNWSAGGGSSADFGWRCTSCKHTWGVAG